MKEPKILFFDIETAPHTALVWGKYEQNALSFVEYGGMLSFAYAWNNGPVHCITRQGQKSDKTLSLALARLFNEADIVVAHNGVQFDVKRTNTQLIKNGAAPHKTPPSIDTLKVARRHFSFVGNSLSDLVAFLGLGKKAGSQPISMWIGCMSGDVTEWNKMVRYNKQDVVLLRKIYKQFKPWITNHPTFVKLQNGACQSCSGQNLQKRGVRIMASGKPRQTYQCKDCGNWSNRILRVDK